MKRFVSCILMVVLLITILPMNCMAVETPQNIVHFEDGSYMVEELRVQPARSAGSVSGTKTRTYYANDGTTSWKVVLSGNFTFTGSSATCTSSSCDATIYHSSWYVVSKSAGKSGASATASASIGRKVSGITVDKVAVDLKLTCDANGNLS